MCPNLPDPSLKAGRILTGSKQSWMAVITKELSQRLARGVANRDVLCGNREDELGPQDLLLNFEQGSQG